MLPGSCRLVGQAVMTGRGRPWPVMAAVMVDHSRSWPGPWSAMAGSVADHDRSWPVMAAIMVASMTDHDRP